MTQSIGSTPTTLQTPPPLRPAAETESTSCLSTIISKISALVAAIFSWISSLWICGLGEAAAVVAPTRAPAEILAERGRGFLMTEVLRIIPNDYPRKAILTITIDGERVGVYHQTLEASAEPGDSCTPLGFCNQGFQHLETALRTHSSLTATSQLKIGVMHVKPGTQDSNPNILASCEASYGTFSTNEREGFLKAWKINEITVDNAIQYFANRSLCDTPLEPEEALPQHIVQFLANTSEFPTTAKTSTTISNPNTSLTPSDRENRIRTGDIEFRLSNALEHAAKQMALEENKAFHYLEAPASFDAYGQTETVGDYQIGFCHAQGRRPSMEDEHLASTFNVNIQGTDYPIHLFGVFDGHNGCEVAKFVKYNLQANVEAALITYNPHGLTEEGIWNALKMACVTLDQKIPEELAHQGSTGTFAMILDGKLWIANVGDSRTVLDNGGTAVQLSEDADPDDGRFKKGIKDRGGVVIFSRVGGSLAVARAFGDQCYGGVVSARPKITVIPLTDIRPNSHLIVACDGIYDVASTDQVAKTVHEHCKESLRNLAKNIVYSAYAANSKDNLTAMVVKLS